MSRHTCSTVVGALLLLPTLSVALYAQEPGSNIPMEAAEAYITTEGDIIYYIPEVSTSPEEEAQLTSLERLKSEFETAVKENTGMQEFIQDNPQAVLAVGGLGALYGMSHDEVNSEIFDAKRVAMGGQPLKFEVTDPFFRAVNIGSTLNTSEFLRNLASNLLQHAATLTCGMPVRPNSVESSADVGPVSFSAAWDVNGLCSGESTER